ncbi:TerB family tellurite resistance protein [Panacibacter ginsenosidivorans]|uniref:TerB family tellurite resistance protein n=1 Tax=Panacibacter ginsenosidivorans TaxID=1813871 RepID=A0A5B8VCM0_9BACT|nr:TerB family tellurite resistance protein [Panacibacter ginsenosidivorans]QEC69277.1 TerB family tellurite resistance protein [Panacibacter ginsenosidivorans]
MKKWTVMIIALCFFAGSFKARAQEYEIQQLLLDIEKLAQLKGILSDMYKGYEILSNGYGAIKDISEGNFNLHNDFLNSLLEVNPVVKNYKRVADIFYYESLIVKTAGNAVKNFQASDMFSPEELDYMSTVYNNLLDASAKNVEDLLTIITAQQLRMSDEERLEGIDRIYNEVQDKLLFLQHFNGGTSVLAAQRKNEWWNIEKNKILFGLPK